MNTVEQINAECFAQPTPEKLADLGPGCFVQVRAQQNCYWVEITAASAGRFSGKVHPELNSPCCQSSLQSGQAADFQGKDITALGCDRYCFC